MQHATIPRSHSRTAPTVPDQAGGLRPQDWTAVRARPLPVLSLRHRGSPDTRTDTWRSLTALVFGCGLATRQTRAIEVHYDAAGGDLALRRFDACLTLPHLETAAEVTAEDLAHVPGVRFETIMGHGPFLHRRPAPAESWEGPPPTAGAHSPGSVHTATHSAAWPCYYVYECSPALAAGVPVVTDVYVTLRPAASSGRPRW
ncbi:MULTISPECIES: hypothetical protein [Streptomyces]|uniref:Uncharacterized protein n=1 Tax=Streptomyces lienomycini TaxID=284035 RepID=A0ABV9WMY1_9ACTN|nr:MULTISPECIES: hypothetical protein [Streptomyces]